MCEVYRISHSHYLGGPPTWNDLDREKAEAYLAWKAEACPECGTRESDWDPKLGGHRHMYIGETRRCLGCEVLEQTREEVSEDDDKGVKVYLTLNPTLLPVFLSPEAA